MLRGQPTLRVSALVRGRAGSRCARGVLAVLGIALLALPPLDATASDAPSTAEVRERVRVLVDLAAEARREQRYEDAVEHLEQAYALRPVPGLLYNLGRTWEDAGRPARALAAYEHCLASAPDEVVSERAHEGLARVRPLAAEGRLVLEGLPAGAVVTLDGEPVGEAPLATITLASGDHRLRATHPDYYPLERDVSVTGGRERHVTVSMVAPTPIDPPPRAAVPTTETRKPWAEATVGLRAGYAYGRWTDPTGATLPLPADGGGTAAFHLPVLDAGSGMNGYYVGVFAEVRLWRMFGIELGLEGSARRFTDRSRWDGGATGITETKVEYYTIDMPLLLKFVLPLGGVRVWAGAGPELSFGIANEVSFHAVDGPALSGDRADFETIGGDDATSIYMTAGLGVDIALGPVRLPIDVRYGYNLLQPQGYYDRIEYDALPSAAAPDTHPTRGVVSLRDTYFVQVGLGMAYDF